MNAVAKVALGGLGLGAVGVTARVIPLQLLLLVIT